MFKLRSHFQCITAASLLTNKGTRHLVIKYKNVGNLADDVELMIL